MKPLELGGNVVARRVDSWHFAAQGWDMEEWSVYRVTDGTARFFASVHIRRAAGGKWCMWTASRLTSALQKTISALISARDSWTE